MNHCVQIYSHTPCFRVMDDRQNQECLYENPAAVMHDVLYVFKNIHLSCGGNQKREAHREQCKY